MSKALKILNDLSLIAEPAFKEFKTTEYIVDFLKKENIKIDKIFKTGCFGTIDIGKEKTIAIRADIDALPINKNSTEFKHLCGHHAHTAGLLLALKTINENREKLKHNIRYIFQPAEETGNGAQFIIDQGAMRNISYVFGLHGDPNYPLGNVCLKKGEVMAGAASFDIKINGKSTHAAFPQYGNDVVVAMSEYINICQKIISRFKDPMENGLISFTMVNCGSAKNILPEKVEISGTFRFFNNHIKSLIKDKMIDSLKAIEKIYNVKGEISFDFVTEPVKNSSELIDKLKKILEKDYKIINDYNKIMGSEDFSEYLKIAKGVFLIVGIATSNNHPPLHNKDFFVTEKAVEIYRDIWEKLAFNFK